jgi:hypothetical protein
VRGDGRRFGGDFLPPKSLHRSGEVRVERLEDLEGHLTFLQPVRPVLLPSDPTLADPALGIRIHGSGDADMPCIGESGRPRRPVHVATEDVALAEGVELHAYLTDVHPDTDLDVRMAVQPLLDLHRPLDCDRGLEQQGEEPVAGGLDDLAGPVSGDDLGYQGVVLFAEDLERLLVGRYGQSFLEDG